MTRGGGSHGARSRARSRAVSSMGFVGGTIDDSVGQAGTDAQGEESRIVDSRQELELETVGRENALGLRILGATIFKRYMHPTGFAWKKVTVDRRMLYWAEFKSFPDEEVLSLFWKKCQDRYRDMVYHMKKDDYQAGNKPDFVFQEDWPAWIAYWQAEETQEKARLAKRNRNTELDGLGSSSQTHHGGARSTVDHMCDMATEQHFSEWEARYQTYLKLHCPDGLWTTDKCNALAAEWIADGRGPNMGEIFCQVVAPDRKGCAIGLGNMAPAIRRPSTAAEGSSSSSILGSGSLHTQVELDARLAEMHAQMNERLSAQQTSME
ncbi:hypothetical protein C2S51_038400 [Perilla frutescens var. frutescens]|nr:hypothetical protein C2S51_038400 [Perilla frutescens var. frutescens]